VRTFQSPPNTEAVRSPKRSARRYSVALGISDLSVRRILHKGLNFHPHPKVVVQELSDHDMAIRRMVAERLIRILSDDVIILMTVEAYFHLSGCANRQLSLLGRGKSTAAPSTASSQYTCNSLVWSGKLRSHRPLLL
jgi:hypothetical protein